MTTQTSVRRSDGMVFWITGLSGAGKTTLARSLHARILEHTPAAVLIDGDVYRAIFARDSGYTTQDRRQVATDVSRLCKFLSDQGLVVVCAAMALFHDIQRWNREHCRGYFEIFLHADLDVLETRKDLYRRARRGELSHVVGVDLPYESPISPDFVANTGLIDRTTLESLAEDIVRRSGCFQCGRDVEPGTVST